jgi:hypothetical protein
LPAQAAPPHGHPAYGARATPAPYAPPGASPWAALRGALGDPRGEHPIKGVSRWGPLVFAVLLLAAAATSVGVGLLDAVATLSSRRGFRPDGLLTGLGVGAVLAALAGLCAYNAWRNWTLGAALFAGGVGYRDRKGVRAVGWGDVEAVWQAVTRRYVNGVYAGTTHVYRARTRAGETLTFDDRLRDVAALGEALVKGSAAALLPGAQRAFDAGERVTFGPLALDRAGLHSGGKSLPWAEVKAVKIERGVVSVDRDGKWFAWTRATVPQIPNFYVLVALLSRLGKLGLPAGALAPARPPPRGALARAAALTKRPRARPPSRSALARAAALTKRPSCACRGRRRRARARTRSRRRRSRARRSALRTTGRGA